MLPVGVRSGVESALSSRAGRPVRITAADPVTGGCISPVAQVATDRGERFFLKWTAAGQPPGLIEAEGRGLRLLQATGAVRVPELIAARASEDRWLLLEWIEPGPASPAAWRRLGEDLASLHRSRGDRFGAEHPNFIGPLPQTNEATPSWPAFWRTRRLEPQLRLAVERDMFRPADVDRFERLLERLDDRIAAGDEEGPSILHGDLWSGNIHMAADGRPALIDPSAYHGHREVDLAMAELFGGFGREFQDAYERAWPLSPGFAARRAVYQLYYLLVHVNVFGAGYVGGCRRALQEAGV